MCRGIFIPENSISFNKYGHYEPSSHADQPSMKVYDLPNFTHGLRLELKKPFLLIRVGERFQILVMAAMEKKIEFSLTLSRVALSVNVDTNTVSNLSKAFREQWCDWVRSPELPLKRKST